jgi:4-hydroxybenzoate polyprenyltransferase
VNYGPVAVFAILVGVVVAVFIGAVIVMVCRDLFDMGRDRRRRRQRRRDRSSVRGEDSTWDRY